MGLYGKLLQGRSTKFQRNWSAEETSHWRRRLWVYSYESDLCIHAITTYITVLSLQHVCGANIPTIQMCWVICGQPLPSLPKGCGVPKLWQTSIISFLVYSKCNVAWSIGVSQPLPSRDPDLVTRNGVAISFPSNHWLQWTFLCVDANSSFGLSIYFSPSAITILFFLPISCAYRRPKFRVTSYVCDVAFLTTNSAFVMLQIRFWRRLVRGPVGFQSNIIPGCVGAYSCRVSVLVLA